MSQLEQFDVLVLGSGQGGQLIAWHLAQAGQRTALVERRWIGGSCPNIACMPSKTEVWSARVAHLAFAKDDDIILIMPDAEVLQPLQTDSREERRHAVIIGLADRLERMMVALGALQSAAEENLHGGFRPVGGAVGGAVEVGRPLGEGAALGR